MYWVIEARIMNHFSILTVTHTLDPGKGGFPRRELHGNLMGDMKRHLTVLHSYQKSNDPCIL